MIPGIDMEALAEENNRLRRELDALKAKHAPKPKPKQAESPSESARTAVFVFLTLGLVLGVVFACAYPLESDPTPQPKHELVDGCYFVRQAVDAGYRVGK